MSESDLGGEETKLSREMKIRLHRTYILRFSKSRQIDVSRGVEKGVTDICREKCREFKASIDAAVEKVLRYKAIDTRK